MRRVSLWIAISLCLLFVCASVAAIPGAAAASSPDPSNVVVGVYLVSVQSVSLQTGTYNLDFYLWFNSTGNPQYVSFEFMNGQAISANVIENTSSYQEYRIRGTFQESFDFRNFPFDSHALTISIEPKTLTADQLVFAPDAATGADATAGVVGWQLSGGSMTVTTHAYPGSTFSRAVFSVTINRFWVQSFMENIMPVALITLIGMLVFAIPTEKTFERIFLSVTALVSAVALNVANASQIPSTGYLTISDEISITVFILFLYSIAVTIWTTRMVASGDTARAGRVNLKAAILVPAAVVIFLGLQLLTFA